MQVDLTLNIVAAVVFGLIPIVLWAEAVWNASRGFKVLTTALLLWWFAIVAVLTVPAFMCDGSAVKGWTACTGPVSAETYTHALIIGPGLFIIPVVYSIMVIVRIARSRAK